MKIFNEPKINTAKVAVVKNYIKDTKGIMNLSKAYKQKGGDLSEVIWISLFDKPIDKPSVADLRKAMNDLGDLLKVTQINVVVDLTSKKDKKTYTQGVIFKDIFLRDNSLWKTRGVLKENINGWEGKFICTSRWDSVLREKESSQIIDTEFFLQEKDINIIIPQTEQEVKDCINTLLKSDTITVDTEGSSVAWEREDFKLYTIQLTGHLDKNTSYVLFYEHPKKEVTNKFKELVKKGVSHILHNRKTIVHNMAYDGLVFKRKFGIDFFKTDNYDSMIIYHFLTNTYKPVPLGLKNIAFTRGIYSDWEYKLESEKKKICTQMGIKKDDFKYEYFDVNDLVLYAGLDTIVLAHLWDDLVKMSQEHIALDVIKKTWEGKEGWQKLMQGTYEMMWNGVPFNLEQAKLDEAKHLKRLKEIETEILENNFIKNAENLINKVQWDKAQEKYQEKVNLALEKGKEFKGKPPEKEKGHYSQIRFDKKFNSGSTDHKRVLFLEVLKLPIIKTSKDTGQASFGDDVITEYAKMRPDFDILKLFSEKARITKIVNTYLSGWIKRVQASFDGRLHGTFNPVTTSARYKGSEGSLLNVPKGMGLKELMQSDYKNGWCTLQLDMASLEERVGLLLHRDPVKMEMKAKNISDPHSISAIIVDEALGLGELSKYDKFNPDHLKEIKKKFPKRRQDGKKLTFGVSFLCSHFSLMKSFGIDEIKAKKILDNYWNTHAGERDFIQSTADSFEEKGYHINFGNVPILTKGLTSNLEDKDNMAIFRTAFNSLYQSSAYTVVRALYYSIKECKAQGLDVRFYNSIYDSIILECKLEDTKKVRELCIKNMTLDIMENQPFSLEADCELGISYEAEMDFEGTDEELDNILEEFKEKHNIKV